MGIDSDRSVGQDGSSPPLPGTPNQALSAAHATIKNLAKLEARMPAPPSPGGGKGLR
jgi:hypothetical protein